MKKAIFAFLAFLQMSVIAYAGEYTSQGFYIGGLGGLNLLQAERLDGHAVKMHEGYMGGAFMGYKMCNSEQPALNLRLEAEVAYRRNDLKSYKGPYFDKQKQKLHGYVDSLTYMGNIFYDIETNSRWTPYIGVGCGYMYARDHVKHAHVKHAHVKHAHFKKHHKQKGFASQYIGGVAYRIGEKTDLGVEYRYLLARKNCNEHTVALSMKQYF